MQNKKKNNIVASLEENLCNIGLCNNFFDMTLLVLKKVDNLNLNNSKSFGVGNVTQLVKSLPNMYEVLVQVPALNNNTGGMVHPSAWEMEAGVSEVQSQTGILEALSITKTS